MIVGTVSGSMFRQISARGAPFLIVAVASMATRSGLAAHYPTATLLLFIWVVSDTMTLTLIAQAPERKPPVHAVLGALAASCFTVWLTTPAVLKRELLQLPLLAGAMVALVFAHIAWASFRAVRTFRTSDDRWVAAASELFPRPLVRLAKAELSIIHMALFRWGGPADMPANSRTFTYHKHLTLMSATLLALSAIEIAAYHLLVGSWSRTAAVVMFVLSDVGFIYLVGIIKSFRFRPILITPDGIRIRAGLLIDQTIPFGAITRVETGFTGTDNRDPSTFNAALLAWPNVLLRLNKPLPRQSILRRKAFTAVAFRLDEPAAFVRLLEWRLGKEG